MGFLSDALGRRKLIIAGFIIFVFASLLPLISEYVSPILSRFLQGICVSTFVVVGRGILTDVLSIPKIIRQHPC